MTTNETTPAIEPGSTERASGGLAIDLDAASAFLTTHGRLLDRRRFDLLLGRGDPGGVLAALAAYRNADGGYGWGLEPDLRGAESQPAAAMHALEVLGELETPTPEAVELCDWLAATTLPGGGLPFALPLRDPTGSAPFWIDADATAPSLMMITQVVAKAQIVARHDPAVAAHPWLVAATEQALDAIGEARRQDAPLHAYEIEFALRCLDAVAPTEPAALGLLADLGQILPASGSMPVEGGTEGEALRPLDFSPEPDGPVRELFDPAAIDADLRRLTEDQQPDGGWVVLFASASPAAAMEWRGYTTVAAVATLLKNR